MFQTEINIALQSLASDSLTWLMRQLTATGYYHFIMGLIIAIMLGVDLRKGFILFQIIAWTAIVNEIAKKLFGMPRPFFADSRVICLEKGWDAAATFRAMGGEDFFSLPARQVIDAFRLRGINFGFPSGHVSTGIAIWGGLAVVFRKKFLAWLAPFMVVLLAFSRLYLGVHFLADILGGALLGSLTLMLTYFMIGSREGQRRFFAAAQTKIVAALPVIAYFFLLFILPLLLAVFSLFDARFAGFFIGLNAAFTLAFRSILPSDHGPLLVRLFRLLLGGLIFLLLNHALPKVLALLLATNGTFWPKFLVAGLCSFLTIWISLQLFARLGLYKKERRVKPR
jgi:membrane-associated phospholipid phosphatase